MIDLGNILRDIQTHNDICRQLLEIVQQENRWLSGDPADESREAPDQTLKASLSKSLTQVVEKIQLHRASLQDAAEKDPGGNRHPDIQSAIEGATDMIMKIVVLDRENEKLLMKKGMVPREKIPSSYQYRPSEALRAYVKSPS
jgi:hypothetical protein